MHLNRFVAARGPERIGAPTAIAAGAVTVAGLMLAAGLIGEKGNVVERLSSFAERITNFNFSPEEKSLDK